MQEKVFKVIASGSSGNCYVISAGSDRLILEAGVSDKLLLTALDYNLDGVVGVPVSHKHKDHAKYIPQISEYFPIYGNADLKEYYPCVNTLTAKKRYNIGNFCVMPLEVEHNVPNFAYVIDHLEIGRIVFATDCVRFPYIIKDVTHIVMECNYVEEVVLRNMLDGEDIRSQSENHMELTESIESVRRLQNPLLRNVILCHLSSRNVDRKEMVHRFESELGITPKFAIKGAQFDISQFDF